MGNRYYNLKNILSKNADYNLIIGERSNGKTYACLLHALEQYLTVGKQSAYIRRWREDITVKRAQSIYSPFDIEKISYRGRTCSGSGLRHRQDDALS